MKINILLVFLHTLGTKQEYIIIAHIPRLLLKKFNFFSLTDTEKKRMKINLVDIAHFY